MWVWSLLMVRRAGSALRGLTALWWLKMPRLAGLMGATEQEAREASAVVLVRRLRTLRLKMPCLRCRALAVDRARLMVPRAVPGVLRVLRAAQVVLRALRVVGGRRVRVVRRL